MSWRTGLGSCCFQTPASICSQESPAPGEVEAAPERVCASSTVPSLVLHGGEDGECIASNMGRSHCLPEQAFSLSGLCSWREVWNCDIAPHCSCFIAAASGLCGKVKLRFHLLLPAVRLTPSQGPYVQGEKGKDVLPTHQDKEPWCTLEGLTGTSPQPLLAKAWGTGLSGVTKHLSGSCQKLWKAWNTHSFSGPWQALRLCLCSTVGVQ